jgi:hypothetical protein
MMLLTTTRFKKIGTSQHHTFLTAVYRKTTVHFENKESLGKVWVLVAEYTHRLQSCSLIPSRSPFFPRFFRISFPLPASSPPPYFRTSRMHPLTDNRTVYKQIIFKQLYRWPKIHKLQSHFFYGSTPSHSLAPLYDVFLSTLTARFYSTH